MDMIYIILGIGTGSIFSFFLTKKELSAKRQLFLAKAEAEASAISLEAENKFQESNLKSKEIVQNAKLKAKEMEINSKKEIENKKFDLDKEKRDLDKDKEKILDLEKQSISLKNEAAQLMKVAQRKQDEYNKKSEEVLKTLEKSAGLTKDEAQKIVLERVEESSRGEIAHIVRKYEERAKKEAKKRADFIIAQATTRFAGEFAGERLINVVDIKNDELKGKIIGKEGRNIKSLEMLLGVDIIIDDTPHTIVVSSFNIYRRAIATKVIETLVEDGRIHPAKIEETYEKIFAEFEDKILEEGEEVVMNLGVSNIHPELVKLIGKLKYRASYGQNALAHSLEVAHLAGIVAAECGGDEILAKRAGILHDIGKALTHDYSGNHVDLGADICRRYKEHDVVINAIYAHHGHEDAKTIECAAVCTGDVLSAARPGARREVLESFLKRTAQIEEIATSKNGVRKAYAINAGREIRVILNAQLINDDEAALLAKEIAKEIEEAVSYPGDIKVNVIREARAVEYAK